MSVLPGGRPAEMHVREKLSRSGGKNPQLHRRNRENPFEKDGCCLPELRKEDETMPTCASRGKLPSVKSASSAGHSCECGGGGRGRVTVINPN